MDPDLLSLSTNIGNILFENHLTISTAESCTGGLVGHVLTRISGASAYFTGGVIAYSNQIKEKALGVKAKTLKKFGAVSSQTAEEMASGIRKKFNTTIGISTTGIAGPTGGTPEKPVGLVWIGISIKNKTTTYECHFDGDREQIQYETVKTLLSKLLLELQGPKNRKRVN